MAEKLFRIRFYKNLNGASNESEWSNEYELELAAESTVEDPALDQAVNDLGAFERTIHNFSVEFKRAVISTMTPGDEPSQAMSRTVGLSFTGRLANDNRTNIVQELSRVLVVNFNGSSGRAGRHQYRGALDSDSVDIRIGAIFLKGNMADYFKGAMATFAATPTAQLLRIVTQKDNQFIIRRVVNFSLGGVAGRQVKTRRKPKVSLDSDAINNRIRAIITEAALISASINAKVAMGSYKPGEPVETNELLAQLQGVVGDLNVTITQ